MSFIRTSTQGFKGGLPNAVPEGSRSASFVTPASRSQGHAVIYGQVIAVGGLMRQPNYQELKKRREAAKKKVKQEKLAKRHGSELPESTPKDPP
jgi:hypothetical protein